MLPLGGLLGWAVLWLLTRAALGLVLQRSARRHPDVSIELDWWRVSVRHSGAEGLAAKLAGRHRRALQRWFSAGAAVGLLAGACSLALLASELATLLSSMLAPAAAAAGGGAAAGGAGAAAEVAQAVPRLQLALPGVTLPISHAAPLWLALAVSLAVHEAGHALAAAAEGVHISAAGCSLMLLVPAAFVELDSADLAGLSRHSMLRVATAGAWHNVALALASCPVAALLAGAGGWALLAPARLLLGYTASLSAALALLNMAPVWFLDGQQALEALLLRHGKPKGLPDQALAQRATTPAQPHSQGSSAGGSGRRSVIVQWILHAVTALYVAVLALHLWQMH